MVPEPECREPLVKDGQIQWDQMRKNNLSENDLESESALRVNGNANDPAQVAEARLERSGDISVMAQEREPRIAEVAVKDGVQTVWIEVD